MVALIVYLDGRGEICSEGFYFNFFLLILNLLAFYFESHSHQMGLLEHT